MKKSVRSASASGKRKRSNETETKVDNDDILSFMQSFKPLNLVSNALNVTKSGTKKRKSNPSKRIIDNMKEKFDSLPPGYCKKRRMAKSNSRGNEQKNKYNNLLEIFREDSENTTPTKPHIQSYPQAQISNITPLVDSSNTPFPHTQRQAARSTYIEEGIDSLLQEELYFQREYIHYTMEELYSLAKIPKECTDNYIQAYGQINQDLDMPVLLDSYNTAAHITNENGFTYITYKYLHPSYQEFMSNNLLYIRP